jgi:L-ascorbate metabolism protein UlaG (beta-lactamase superfamily)
MGIVKVTWWGHATVAVEDDGYVVLTDPVLRDRLAHLYRRRGPTPRLVTAADAVVISHVHPDHCDLASLRMLPAATKLVVPRGAAWFLRQQLRRPFTEPDIVELAPGDETTVGTLHIRAVPARHPHGRLPGSRVRAEPVGYLISGSRTTWFAGDTGLYPEMSQLGPVDLALVPVWGWGWTLGPGHLDPAGAAEAVRRIAPALAVPIHWGTFWPVGCARVRPDRFHRPGEEFAELARAAAPQTGVRVLLPGASLALRDARQGR